MFMAILNLALNSHFPWKYSIKLTQHRTIIMQDTSYANSISNKQNIFIIWSHNHNSSYWSNKFTESAMALTFITRPVFILVKLTYQVLKVLLPHQQEPDGHQGHCKKPLFSIHSCPEFISYSFHFWKKTSLPHFFWKGEILLSKISSWELSSVVGPQNVGSSWH